MLICIVCGKTIANCDNGKTIRYGGCASCPIVEVAAKMSDHSDKLLAQYHKKNGNTFLSDVVKANQ